MRGPFRVFLNSSSHLKILTKAQGTQWRFTICCSTIKNYRRSWNLPGDGDSSALEVDRPHWSQIRHYEMRVYLGGAGSATYKIACCSDLHGKEWHRPAADRDEADHGCQPSVRSTRLSTVKRGRLRLLRGQVFCSLPGDSAMLMHTYGIPAFSVPICES